jgi:hypothetical protein
VIFRRAVISRPDPIYPEKLIETSIRNNEEKKMKKITPMIMSIFILLSIGTIKLYADGISDYIIMNDIAPYERYTKERNPDTLELKTIPGYWIYRNSGVLMGTDHFLSDHMDVTYETKYQSKTIHLGMEIQVTQHTGGDSDRWLLHEIEDNYRDDETATLGLLTNGAVMRKINNQRVLWIGIGGGAFTWVSNNVVVKVSYTDMQGTKPEPIEVVKAYLAKFPSTITMTDAELKASVHNTQWVKDEMDRRLWLCDKWNAQSQAGKATQADLVYNLDRSLNIFIQYRQKYYGVSSETDQEALLNYKQAKDLTSIQTKLTEYKTWWSANKGKRITLP